MDNFLLKNENGEEVWDDKFKLGYVHLDSFRKFATKNILIFHYLQMRQRLYHWHLLIIYLY